MERENLCGDAKGKGTSGSNREAESTDAPARRSSSAALRNCTRDEGRSFEFGNQVLISSRRKLLSSKAMVVSVAETPGQDSGRHG